MCFHCENGNHDLHIPTEYRKAYAHMPPDGRMMYKCTHCNKELLKGQFEGTSPHWCGDRHIMIAQGPEVRELDLFDIITNWKSHPLTATVTLSTGEIKFYLKGKEWNDTPRCS